MDSEFCTLIIIQIDYITICEFAWLVNPTNLAIMNLFTNLMTGEIYPVLTKTVIISNLYNFRTTFLPKHLHLEFLHWFNISKWHSSSLYENNKQIPKKQI